MSENAVIESVVLAQTSEEPVEETPNLLTEEPKVEETSSTEVGDKEAAETAVEGEQSESGEYTDFTMPEGVELDTVALEKYAPIMKELGLTQEQAQKMVTARAEEIQSMQAGQAEAFNQLKKDWTDQSTNDKEFGGDKLEGSLSDARIALNKFGNPELTKLLNETGMGNHPEIIRFTSKIGALLKEDLPGNPGGAKTKEQDVLSIMYPD